MRQRIEDAERRARGIRLNNIDIEQSRNAFIDLATKPIGFHLIEKNDKVNSSKETERIACIILLLKSTASGLWKNMNYSDTSKNNTACKNACAFIQKAIKKAKGTTGSAVLDRYAALFAMGSSPQFRKLLFQWHKKYGDSPELRQPIYGDAEFFSRNAKGTLHDESLRWAWAAEDYNDPEGIASQLRECAQACITTFLESLPAKRDSEEDLAVEEEQRLKEVEQGMQKWRKDIKALEKEEKVIENSITDVAKKTISIKEIKQEIDRYKKNIESCKKNKKELLTKLEERLRTAVTGWVLHVDTWLSENTGKVNPKHLGKEHGAVFYAYNTFERSSAGLYGNWVMPSVKADGDTDIRESASKLLFRADNPPDWNLSRWQDIHDEDLGAFYDCVFKTRITDRVARGGAMAAPNPRFAFVFLNWGGVFHFDWTLGKLPAYRDFHPLLNSDGSCWPIDKADPNTPKDLWFLPCAIFGTPMEGGYMTDFYKGINTKGQTELNSILNNDLDIPMTDMLCTELEQLMGKNEHDTDTVILFCVSGVRKAIASALKHDPTNTRFRERFAPWKVITWPHHSSQARGAHKASRIAFAFGRAERAMRHIDELNGIDPNAHKWSWPFAAPHSPVCAVEADTSGTELYPQLWDWLCQSFVHEPPNGQTAVCIINADKKEWYRKGDVEAAFLAGYEREEELLANPGYCAKDEIPDTRRELDELKKKYQIGSNEELKITERA